MANRFKPKDGQYYYAPRGGVWGIWQHHEVVNGISHGTFVKYCATIEEAAEEVGRRNGWLK